MSRVTMSGMTRWLAAVLVTAFVATGALHGTADAQAFKKKSAKPAAATPKKAPAKKAAAKKAKGKKSHVADSSRADDLTPDADEDAQPTKIAKGGKAGKAGKKVKQLAPEEQDDYVLIEDEDE